ncbi:adenine deaminase C-terminal domain-containing protein [Peribacillus simplex]|uniref:adenine deaminase C-terminal domain-containing protein n=1 Tax=Peribacillus TaxID=2675229 RepID=UPI00366AA1B9
MKLAVIERHHLTNQLVGLGLKSVAIATTVAYNSHNLIIACTNDQDMLMAA